LLLSVRAVNSNMANQESSTSNDRTLALNETSERPPIATSQPSSLRAHLAMTEQNITYVKNNRKTEMEMAAEQKHHESERLPIASAQPSIVRRPSADHPYKRRDTIVKTDTRALADNTTAIVNQIKAHVTGPESARNLLERQEQAEMAAEQKCRESERPPIVHAQPPSASAITANSSIRASSSLRERRGESLSTKDESDFTQHIPRRSKHARHNTPVQPNKYVSAESQNVRHAVERSETLSASESEASPESANPSCIIDDALAKRLEEVQQEQARAEQKNKVALSSNATAIVNQIGPHVTGQEPMDIAAEQKYPEFGPSISSMFELKDSYPFRYAEDEWLVTKDENGVTQQILRSSNCVHPDPSVQPRKYGEKRKAHPSSERSETLSASEAETSPGSAHPSNIIDIAQPRAQMIYSLQRRLEEAKQQLARAKHRNRVQKQRRGVMKREAETEIKKRNQYINEQREAIEERNQYIDQQRETIEEQREMIKEKDQHIKILEEEVDDKRKMVSHYRKLMLSSDALNKGTLSLLQDKLARAEMKIAKQQQVIEDLRAIQH